MTKDQIKREIRELELDIEEYEEKIEQIKHGRRGNQINISTGNSVIHATYNGRSSADVSKYERRIERCRQEIARLKDELRRVQ
jgi:phage shock protein A